MGTGGVLGCGGWEPPDANPLKLDSKCRYVFLEFICLFWLVLSMEQLRKKSDITKKYLERLHGRNHINHPFSFGFSHWSNVPGENWEKYIEIHQSNSIISVNFTWIPAFLKKTTGSN